MNTGDDNSAGDDPHSEESAGVEDTERNGGGKHNSNRQAGRGARRHTPYGGKNRAVYHSTAGDTSDSSCRVYVGNLSWDVTCVELAEHMKTTGSEVTRADVLASPDGRSKGCGIVEFATAEGASRAVLTLNDTELMGRQIFVREDREDGSGGGYYTQQPAGAVTGDEDNSNGGAVAAADGQNRRVYVGNLSWEVAWQDLKDHMRESGEVIYAEVMTEADGRSKGCGIVEYATSEGAKEAIATMTDTELKGRMIFVREDRETGSGGGVGGGGFKQAGGGRGGTSVYVGNLAYETSWQDLKDHMRKAGNVDQANVLQQDDGRSKGCGIVVYQNQRDAARAIRELQNSLLDGRPIFVREDREQGGGRGRGNRQNRGKSDNNFSESSSSTPGTQLFVGNLSWDTNWRDLKDFFSKCGEVERADVAEAPDGKKKGFGTVRFFNAKDAANAIEQLNGMELQGRDLLVRIDNKAR